MRQECRPKTGRHPKFIFVMFIGSHFIVTHCSCIKCFQEPKCVVHIKVINAEYTLCTLHLLP